MNKQRVKLFTPRTSFDLTEKLNHICEQFLENSKGMFDEVLLVLVNDTVLPKYDFSYRSDGTKPSQSELESLVLLSSTLNIGDFAFIDSAEGTDFDILIRLSEQLFIAVNNTGATLDDLVPEEVNKKVFLTRYVGELFTQLLPVQKQLVDELEE
jgi:hypothetical protein